MKIRNPNGFGSITKLSGKRRRPFIVRKTDYIDSETGIQKMKILGYFAKYQDAMAFLAEYNKADNPDAILKKGITFEKLYDDYVVEKYDKHDKKLPAYYAAAFKRCESLYKKNIDAITLPELVGIIDSIDNISGKQSLKLLLGQLYKYAMKYDYVDKNLATRIESYKHPASEMHKPFTEDELKKLWGSTDKLYSKIWLIYCYSGLRPSELTNIKTTDVHLDECYMIGGMKTDAAKNRVIPIADCIKPFIQELYNPDNKYLLPAPRNSQQPMGLMTLTRHLNEVLEPLGISHKAHDGRHTCATMLDQADVNIIVIQRILGHRSSSITGKVYIHKTLQEMLEAVNKLPFYK